MLVHLELSQCVIMNLCVPTLCSEKNTHPQFFSYLHVMETGTVLTPRHGFLMIAGIYVYSVSQKNPPYGFLKFFPKWLGIFNQFLHTYYTIISALDYKFLFKYLQL